MTTQLTPVTIGDKIVTLPSALADSIAQTRQRFDAMKDDDEEDEEEMEEEDEEEEEMSFAEKMKAAKAKKAAKKDSADLESVLSHIDSLEAENEVLASLLQDQYQDESHEDSDDEDGHMDEMDSRTPQEIALEMMAGYEQAKPFLSMESTIANYGNLYDIYEDAITSRYPDLLMDPDLEDEENYGRIDPNDEDQLKGAFLMMVAIARPMQKQPMSPGGLSMDSADRAFSQALGSRADSTTAIRSTPTPTPYY